MSCVKSYTYPIAPATRGILFGPGAGEGENAKYYISVNILGGDGEYHPVRVIADTGNDITLLTKATADMLGFHPSMGTVLEIGGIKKGMVSMLKKIRTHIQLGNLTPVVAEVAFAVDDESLEENLLGNKGILASGAFEFRFSESNLTIVDKINTCDMTSGMAMEKARYSDDNKTRDNSFWTTYRSRNMYYW